MECSGKVGGVDDFSEQIKSWNPMHEDYMNSQFNKYNSGPGANLDLSLQPSQLGKQSAKYGFQQPPASTAVPYLVFKNLPAQMTKQALFNLCSSYGKVNQVRDSNKNAFFFVDFPSVADLDAVFRALENNTYGFVVHVGKQMKESTNNVANNRNYENLPPVPPTGNIIDMESRIYNTSSKNHPRPHVERSPVVSSADYNSTSSLLQLNDPERHFLIEEDAHAMELAGLINPNEVSEGNKSKFKYCTGRAFIEISDEARNLIEKNKNSSSLLDSNGELYRNVQSEKRKYLSGLCIECKQICDSVCSRCSEYFCGIECQRNAWPKHRYVCGKPEHLWKYPESCLSTESSSTNSDVPMSFKSIISPKALSKSNMPKSGNVVTITSISKTNVVFIRSKTYEDNLLYFKTISAIHANVKCLNPLKELPRCGEIVVTLFQNEYNRAMILNAIDASTIKLVFMDFGNLGIKRLDQLYEVPPYYYGLPRLAIPVMLKDVPDVYMTDEIRTFMYSYLNDIDLKLKYNESDDKINGVHKVELFDEATNQCFNKVIKTLATPAEPQLSEDIIYREYLKHQFLPKGDHVDLIVMDNSLLCTGCISCTTKEYALGIQKFQDELQKYAESLEEQNYAPRVDELCIARYSIDQKWYRGQCIDLVGDGNPTIVFFDYGNIALVNVKDIRRYPPQFTFPIFTSDCEIQGLPENCDEKLVSKLEELIPNGSIIHCDAVEIFEEDKFHVIKVKNIIQALQKEGLLEQNKMTSYHKRINCI